MMLRDVATAYVILTEAIPRRSRSNFRPSGPAFRFFKAIWPYLRAQLPELEAELSITDDALDSELREIAKFMEPLRASGA